MKAKHKIIIRFYTGSTQNDSIFYGKCTLDIINREIEKAAERVIIDRGMLAALLIFPDTKQYVVLDNPKSNINYELGYMSDDEYKTFVLERYFNQ